MRRITRDDLASAIKGYNRRLASREITKTVRLQIGSKVNGNAYRLYFVDENGDLSYALGTSSGYLGMTAREAYDTIWTIVRTMDDLEYYASL